MGEIKEIYYGIYDSQAIKQELQKNMILLKAQRPVLIGTKCLLKVNMNIGVSSDSEYNEEVKKLVKISALPFRPDSMMDHTIVSLKKPLWKSMVETFDGAVGTLPHYLVFDENMGIDECDFFDNLLDMVKGGVSFMTLHPTADLEMYNRAVISNRLVPTTSRGGYVLLKDQAINKRKENIVAKNFDKILRIFREYNVAISIGTVFRPATIWEAMDSFHIEETKRQKKYIDLAKQSGVAVMMEGIGHIPFNMMKKYADMIREYEAPLMPLGPIPSDEIIGFDHISNALGSLTMAQTGVVGMINSVTREEHTGKVPSFESILEGLKTAKTVAHCFNISKFQTYKERTEVIGITRANSESCVQRGGIFLYESIDDLEKERCSRCMRECPLKKIIV